MRRSGGHAVSTLILFLLATFLPASARGQAPPSKAIPAPAAPEKVPDADVVYRGEVLFTIQGKIGAVTPAQRAKSIVQRIEAAAKNRLFDPATIKVVEEEIGSTITSADVIFMLVLDVDAREAGVPRQALAESHAAKIRGAIAKQREEFLAQHIAISAGQAGAATLILLALFWILRRLRPRLSSYMEGLETELVKTQRLGSHQLYYFVRRTLLGVLRVTGWFALLATIFVYVLFVLSVLPWTAGAARALWRLILTPLTTISGSIIAYLPNLFYIIIISAVTYFVLKVLKLFFDEVGQGDIVLPGFERDWADSTFKVVRVLVLAFSLVALFPYLPGSGSDAFKGISLGLGLLFSISSSSAISNAFAGLVLTYTKAFRVGDRVQIGETYGDVTEKTLLVTRVRTIKNVAITIPNSTLLSGQIQNFTQANQYGGFRIHTTITIGYDAPWRIVHQLLLNAAKKTGRIVGDPAPFVLQTALNDFYVSYEINGYTLDARHSPEIYSELHQNIQDEFNSAGVEIMSPHFSALRDGNTVTIPEEKRPSGYTAPGFKISRE